MQTIYLHQYLSNILSTFNNIPFEIFNNSITTYCVIFIIVFLTLLGIVLYAEERTNIPVHSLLDTKADLERRTNVFFSTLSCLLFFSNHQNYSSWYTNYSFLLLVLNLVIGF